MLTFQYQVTTNMKSQTNKWYIDGVGAVFLEQPITDAMFRPISGQACGFGFVKDFDSIGDFVSDD